MANQISSQTWKVAAFLAIAGALLNGAANSVVAAWLAHTYIAYQTKKAALSEISMMAQERRVRAGLVASALERNAELEEVKERRRSYDESYVNWNKSLHINLMWVRDILETDEYTFLERQVEQKLTKVMREIDACLTRAYDERSAGKDPKGILAECKMPSMLEKNRECAYYLVEELRRIARVSFLPWSSSRIDDAARQKIETECG
jgi:hypothetical protein